MTLRSGQLHGALSVRAFQTCVIIEVRGVFVSSAPVSDSSVCMLRRVSVCVSAQPFSSLYTLIHNLLSVIQSQVWSKISEYPKYFHTNTE